MKYGFIGVVLALALGCEPGPGEVVGEPVVLIEDDSGEAPPPDMAPSDDPVEQPAPPIEDETARGGRFGLEFENAWGERIQAALFAPRGVAPIPTVIVLHGSGGLFDEPAADEAPFPVVPGRREMESQFEDWTAMLAAEGWAVLLPSSFASRGFYDWNDSPPPGVATAERLRWRTGDALAAIDFACRHPRLDCDRLALVGISNGGSGVVMSLFDSLDRIDDLDGLRPPAHDVRLGVALYPGCGLHGYVSLDMPDAYLSRRPLHVFHGSDDPLVENCRTRAEQASLAAERSGVDDAFTLEVFDGVGHSFDSSPDNEAEEAARAHTRATTVELLHEAFDQAPR